ncbi:glycoprotein endo-alpha-1,2-mannosidase [Cephus cinctus]|uniref:Glycoprotein endo-alpha-1,2-mannosidase n=1 Tax=Cephus cinctus TaxID=211228 RepID=A0AAJ7FV39_CEPCN|nr:glycoprotein endo-alpha-1,2-mannosidase [Cephus cinctus]XP_015609755.1 glycoprotein endo-alpha-1,2-mannosidase [Cephus cinctus]XP_015609757.1 glycoprotein endo-alpha-1,2-mannosidase [Cephus cinctus]XP_024947698.1 glycoprotein endo-alpha-1,2-mannosidase [Cephus cinctus]
MFGSIVTAVSLRRCFYLSAVVLVLSTLMAAVIIVKLSPLESVKCQPHAVTPAVEWSTISNQQLESVTAVQADDNKKENNDKKYKEMREKIVQNKIARMSRKMRNKVLPLLSNNTIVEPNYNVHIFYYAWYRSLSYDRAWKHWNHAYLPNWKKNDKRVFPDGNHEPPADIGANYYPSLGCYSSMDPKVIDLHMKQLKEAGVGVVVVSWTPPTANDNTDSIMPDLLDTAHRYHLKIAPHIEPYAGRNPINLIEHIRHLFNKYGSHPALYRMKRQEDDTVLPVMYIYDSYVFPSTAWRELLSERGNLTLRGTEIDAIYIGLLVESQHRNHIKKSHFDGFYTYFAVNGFSHGSSWKNWKELNKFAIQNKLLFIPSLGPGYIDTQVRPWNSENTRHRRHGQYYEMAWRNVLNSGANIVSITSFNEWHEGTQIEPAKPASNKDFTYLDYEPEGPNFYLNLTKLWVDLFTKKHSNSNAKD